MRETSPRMLLPAYRVAFASVLSLQCLSEMCSNITRTLARSGFFEPLPVRLDWSYRYIKPALHHEYYSANCCVESCSTSTTISAERLTEKYCTRACTSSRVVIFRRLDATGGSRTPIQRNSANNYLSLPTQQPKRLQNSMLMSAPYESREPRACSISTHRPRPLPPRRKQQRTVSAYPSCFSQ